MVRDATAVVAVVTLCLAVVSQQTLGFHITSLATSSTSTTTRCLQQRPTSSSSPQTQRPQQPLPRQQSLSAQVWGVSSRNLNPLAAADGGGGGEGFSAPAEKMSRKAAKKAKARGEVPAIPTKKVAPPQEVSKAVVAEVLGGQAAQGGDSSDAAEAR